MADGRNFENFKLLYLRYRWSYCDEILYGDGTILHPINSWKLVFSKIQDSGPPSFWKFLNCRISASGQKFLGSVINHVITTGPSI